MYLVYGREKKGSVAFFKCKTVWLLHFHLFLNFRALVGVIDDYFDGYYTEEMIESQVLLNLWILMHALFSMKKLNYVAAQYTG